MQWNPQNRGSFGPQQINYQRGSLPANLQQFQQPGNNVMNMVRNSFSPSPQRYSLNNGIYTNPYSIQINQEDNSRRNSVRTSNASGTHEYLKNMMRGSRASVNTEEMISSKRVSPTFLSEEVQNIVDKIQKAEEDVEKAIQSRNSLNKQPEQEIKREPQPDFKKKNQIESIPEDNDEHQHSSHENSRSNLPKKYSIEEEARNSKIKTPNVFTSGKSSVKEQIADYDHERVFMETSNYMSEAIKSEVDNSSSLVNIYSERKQNSNVELKDTSQNGTFIPSKIKKVVNYEDLEEDKTSENLRQIYQNDSSFQRERSLSDCKIGQESLPYPETNPLQYPEFEELSPIDKASKLPEPERKTRKFGAAANNLISSDERRLLQATKRMHENDILELEKEIKNLEDFKSKAISQLEAILDKNSNSKKRVKTQTKKRPLPPQPIPQEKPPKLVENPQNDSVYSNGKGYNSIYSHKKDFALSPQRFYSPVKSAFSKNTEKNYEGMLNSRFEDSSKILKVMTGVERELMNSIKKKRKLLRTQH